MDKWDRTYFLTEERLNNMNLVELAELLNTYSDYIPQRPSTKSRCYEICDRFARRFVRQKKCYHNEDEYEEIAITIAEEIYLLITSDKEITNWLGYANAAYKGWIEVWAKLNNKTMLRPSVNIDKYYDPNGPKRYASADVNMIIDHLEIRRILDNLFDEVNKYMRYRAKWENKNAQLNARVSMMLSIKYKHFVNFRLSDNDAALCRLLYNKYKQHAAKVINSVDIPILSDKQYAASMVGEIFKLNGVYDHEEA